MRWLWFFSLSAAVAACDGGGGAGGGGGGGGVGGGGGAGGGSGGAVVPAGHPRIYLNDANRARLAGSLDAGAAAATRFSQMVDAQMGGADYYDFRASDAALLGALGRGQAYCDYAVGLTEAWVAAEEATIAGGGAAEVGFDSYLYVGEVVGGIALVYDWCFDTLTAEQRTRWRAYADQAVWNVWHPEEATWGGQLFPWSGWSIDNPSNNYHYSFLRATMLLGLATKGEDDQADGWLSLFRDQKLETLFATFESDLQGGGSREGTGYGVSHRELFRLYDLWEATTGERVWDRTAHTRASLAHFLHVVVPTQDRIAPIGDHARDSTAALFDYHRTYALVLQRLLGADDPLAQLAQTLLDDCSVPEMSQPFVFVDDFLYYDPAHPKRPLSDLSPVYRAAGTAGLFFRSDWGAGATWGALQVGPYTESHAHRDQGSLLYYRGEWLAYDQNILSHSGIVQDEEAHDLVRISSGGATVHQHEGSSAELVALADEGAFLYASVDVTPMYDGDPAVPRLERELLFVRPDVFVVFDRADLGAGAEATWLLSSPLQPTLAGGVATFQGAVAGLEVRAIGSYDATVFDWTQDADMNGGFRLELRPTAPGDARFLTVLAPPGRVVTATPGAPGAVTLGLDDGSIVDVAFSPDAPGGALTLEVGGQTLWDGPLPTGVAEPPLLAP